MSCTKSKELLYKTSLMKTAFLSTSHRTLELPKTLHKNSEVVFCVTKEDVKVGRHQKTKKNEIKVWADKHKLVCLQISGLEKNSADQIIEHINTSKPDLILMADFAFIIPGEILEAAGERLVNVHFSLLPKYRGAAPGQFAILNGDDKTGITFQHVHKEVDQGNILHQVEYKLTHKETAGELYESLFELANAELPKFLEKYEKGDVTPLPQDENLATYTRSRTNPDNLRVEKEDAYVELTESPEAIERTVRAFTPWPIVWTHLKNFRDMGFKLKDREKESLRVKLHNVEVRGNVLKITELQVEGKNKIGWEEFENGYLAMDSV
jgi:methionyl-tRNA formyltransferase